MLESFGNKILTWKKYSTAFYYYILLLYDIAIYSVVSHFRLYSLSPYWPDS